MHFPGNGAQMFGLKCGCKLEFNLMSTQEGKLRSAYLKYIDLERFLITNQA